MPTRSPEQRKKIDALEIIKPSDKYCNARIAEGRYCRNVPGYKTDHLGTGRCYLHGGASAGRPIVTGLYSKKLDSNLQTEFDKLVKDPALIDLYSELALTKVFVSQLLNSLRANMLSIEGLDEDEVNEMDDEQVIKKGNWMIQYSNKSESYVPSAELNSFIKIMEMTRKIYKDIVDAETKSMNTLTIRHVYNIISQIKNQMADTCGMCPVRTEIGKRLQQIRIASLDKNES
jgi:hypothetical protein